MVYEWKAASRFNIDVQVVGRYLEKLRDTQGGVLTPEAIVTAAWSEKSPIHSLFQWDDQLAAREHRHEVARSLLRSIKCVVRVQTADGVQERSTRAFVAVQNGDRTDYAPVEVAMASPDYRQQLIVQARRELEAFKRKYAELDELLGLFEAIDAALPALEGKGVAA